MLALTKNIRTRFPGLNCKVNEAFSSFYFSGWELYLVSPEKVFRLVPYGQTISVQIKLLYDGHSEE
jgi:hypothetical protein